MGRNRFTSGEKDRIDLSDGDWIEVKRFLNTGDQKKLENAGMGAPAVVDGRVVYPIDWEKHDIDRALVVITDWSLTKPDSQGRNVAVPLTRDAIKALDPDFFVEVNRAVVTHILNMARAKNALREAELAAKAAAQATQPVSEQEPPTGSQPTTTPPLKPTSDETNSTGSAPTSA